MADKNLNPDQIEAINHPSGPLLIIAGAGTGKTTVVTERVKWLISQNKALPSEILCLTFTEKAAKEMEERIDIALPYGYTQMWTLTFHSFCDRILRDEGIHIGLNPGYSLLTDTSAISLFRRHLFEMDLDYFRPLGNPTKFISGILQHISRLKDEDVSEIDYRAWVETQRVKLGSNLDDSEKIDISKYLELAHIYEVFEKLKHKEGVLGFPDLICQTLRLFRSRPNILKNYQQKFKYILVDEFQDTNYAQNQLVALLANSHQNLTVVADDDQSIYRWRGAAVSNVIQFRQHYPQAKIIVLTQNYRSSQEILDRSYDLIQHNNPDRLEVKENINKKLSSARKVKGEKISFIHAERVENEADSVAKEIKSLVENSQVEASKSTAPSRHISYKDVAILVRANAHSDPFVRALSRHGIPHQFLGPGQLFHQSEVKDLIAYLKILVNFEDDASFFRVLCMDYFDIATKDLVSIGNFAKKLNIHLFAACEVICCGADFKDEINPSSVPQPFIPPSTKTKICKLIEIINRHIAISAKETAGQLLFYFLQDTGILSSILEFKHPIDEIKANNIMRFFSKLKSFESDHLQADVATVMDWIDLSMELGESPLATDMDWTENDAVNILTIHSSKGLEFPVVFLVNLVSQRFPSIERQEQIPIPSALIKEILPEGDFHLQEERRLFYVGMTRACDKLYLTAANYYGEGKRAKKLSPFIFESLGPKADSGPTRATSQLSLLDWGKTPPDPSVPPRTTPSSIIPIQVNYLSYSQIQTFLDCPLHYKAKYILKIPSPPSAASTFGNSIHLTLKDFYSQAKLEKLVNPQKLAIDLLSKNWSSGGFTSKDHERKYFDKGVKFLSDYIESNFTPDHLPEKLEEPFTIPIYLDNKMMKIGGKIDRVDVHPDGTIEIIDYKTGTKPLTEKEARTNLQLSFYALVGSSLRYPPFNGTSANIKLTLYYFDSQQKVSTTRTPEELLEAKKKIFEYADLISHSDFKCSKSKICQMCDYRILCDMASSSED